MAYSVSSAWKCDVLYWISCSWWCPPSCSGWLDSFWGDQCCRFSWTYLRWNFYCCCGWSISMTWLTDSILEGDFVIVISVFGYSLLYSLCFGIIVHHSVFAESGRHRFHFKEQSAILFLSLCHPPLGNGVHHSWFSCDSIGGGIGGVSGKRFDFFQFIQEFDVGLVDLHAMLVKFMGEWFAFGLFDMGELLLAGVIKLELMFAVLSYLG